MPVFARASAAAATIAAAALVAGLIAGVFVTQSVGATNTTQVEALWKDYVVAQKRLQFDTARLMVDRWPQLAEIVRLQRDQQFALLELQNMRFQYLLVFDPDRIVYDRGLDRFADFEWSEADDEALRASNPQFVKLERWAEMNARRISEHPDLVTAGENLVVLQREKPYASTVERYEARMADLESALATIARAQKRREERKAQKATVGP